MGLDWTFARTRRHKTLSTIGPKPITRIVAMRLSFVLFFIWLSLTPEFASALSLNPICLKPKLGELVNRIDGQVGICVSDGHKGVAVHGSQHFALVNVFKLPVAVAVLDAVDKGQLHLNDVAVVQSSNLGMSIQPLAKLVGPNGFKTTIEDLLVRMLMDSDGAATNFLVAKLGGPRRIQSVLDQKGIRGFHIDRTEPEVDAEEVGLRWAPKYLNEKSRNQAISAESESARESGFYASQHHNTATPLAVGNLLRWLADGWLLSPRSSALLLETLAKTRTFPDELRAGLPTGWLLAHETGTSSTLKGVTGATNDAGILIAPSASTFVVIAVFISNSRASEQDRAALIANVARAVGSCSE